MSAALRSLRKLVLGETLVLPAGVACALGAGALMKLVAPEAWAHAGGFLLLGLLFGALAVSLRSG
jgi:hypothetical protein